MQIEKLDSRGYRKFGITTGIIVGLLFGLLIPWLFGFNFPLWPWIVLAVLAGLGLIVPTALQPVYVVWMKFGLVMNWLNTRLILGIIFYLLFLPVGLIMRLFGKDPMRRKLDKSLASYRIISEDEDRNNVERPY